MIVSKHLKFLDSEDSAKQNTYFYNCSSLKIIISLLEREAVSKNFLYSKPNLFVELFVDDVNSLHLKVPWLWVCAKVAPSHHECFN